MNIKLRKILICILPIIVIVLLFLVSIVYKDFIDGKFLPCWFNLLTGYLCPGCGGTRSFYALIHGDIISSFKYNAFVPLMMLFLILLYFRLFLKIVMQKDIKVLPENDKWVYIFLVMFLVYFIVRNFFI